MFVKKSMEIDLSRKTPTFDPFQYDPLEDINNPIITHGVLQCPIYESGENYLKPAFLQPQFDTNILKITASNSDPLSIVFANGFEFGHRGKHTKRFNSFITKINQIVSLKVIYSAYIYAQYNHDINSIEFGVLYTDSNNVTYDIAEPSSKNVDDHWFDIQNNYMKYWKWNTQKEEYQWTNITRTFLGKVLVNDSFKIYQIETWYPNKTSMSMGYIDINTVTLEV